ncbi:hypothetical protein FRC02_003854 [Tulasnella sp. 418]|nr:hypothetical protein FRC02_003854 [Tulasnella sp. 418]
MVINPEVFGIFARIDPGLYCSPAHILHVDVTILPRTRFAGLQAVRAVPPVNATQVNLVPLVENFV